MFLKIRLVQNLLFCFLLIRVSSCMPSSKKTTNTDTVVIFAFSGLRWDSLQKLNLTKLKQFSKHGVIVHRKIDAFQTESLPSFITMVTGQYPEEHGILNNKMKDVSFNEKFDASVLNRKWWNKVEPIWQTNENAGNYSALCYWPSWDVTFPNQNRTYAYNCSDKRYVDPFKELTLKGDITQTVMPFSERVEQVKDWLSLKSKKPSFIGVYFEEPLRSIMKYGLDSKEVKRVSERMEQTVHEMHTFLKESNLDGVNFVVTGESGYTELQEHQEIYLEDYIDKNQVGSYEIIDDGTIMTIYPKNKESKKILLKKWTGAHKHITVYDGEKLPTNFHFSNTNRTAPIIIAADERWRIFGERVVDKKKALMGYHGKFPSTHAIFMAQGPAFAKQQSVDVMSNVDVYGLLCKALHIKPHTYSGNLTIINNLLRKEENWYVDIVKKVTHSTTGLTIAIIAALILLFIALYLVICSVYRTVGWCACPKYPVKVNISSPMKLSKKREQGGQHLLSDDEFSSDVSDTDDELNKYSKK